MAQPRALPVSARPSHPLMLALVPPHKPSMQALLVAAVDAVDAAAATLEALPQARAPSLPARAGIARASAWALLGASGKALRCLT